jgi:hypothetical protein
MGRRGARLTIEEVEAGFRAREKEVGGGQAARGERRPAAGRALRDATVHTGVWKHPVAGPRMARRLNLDGDGQGDLAGHGGEYRAVLVYQIESYRYWQEQLGRDDFVYGQFGENFTIEGLPDDEVCIGDRYRIGEAEFEVTQPRVTLWVPENRSWVLSCEFVEQVIGPR